MLLILLRWNTALIVSSYLALSHRNLLEKKDPSEVTLEEAKEAIRTCVRTLFYRDCRSTSRFQMAVVSADGAAVEKPTVIDSNWEIANFNLGYE